MSDYNAYRRNLERKHQLRRRGWIYRLIKLICREKRNG